MELPVRSGESIVRKVDTRKYKESTDDDEDDPVRNELTKKYSEV